MARKQYKLFIRLALLIATVISLFFVPWPLVKAWIMPLPATVQDQVNKAIDHGFDGIIVYINQHGGPPEFYASGWKNREEKIPANPHSLFKIASISKLYDAVAVAKLVNDNRLSLENSITKYLPELAGRIEYANQITIRMLVEHRSGIPNLTDTPGFWTNPPRNIKEALERIFDQPAAFEPDQDYAYSNTNFLLLSEILKQVLGYSHHQYLKEEILIPMGLNNTFFSLSEVNMNDLMSGYYVGVEEDIKSVNYGSMIATAEDVGEFLRALNDGSLFDENEQSIYSSIYVYNHEGLIPGYQSIAKYHKDIDTVVVQFVNTTNFEGYTWNLSQIVYNRIIKILRRQANS